MSDDRIPMTREGYEKLKSDLDRMQNKEMIEVARRIAGPRVGRFERKRRVSRGPRGPGDAASADRCSQRQVEPGHDSSTQGRSRRTPWYSARVTVKDVDLGDEEDFHPRRPG